MPVEYTYKTFEGSKKNYKIYNKEVFSVVRALRKFRFYVINSPTILYTNNVALRYIIRKHQDYGRQTQWVMEMLEYALEIKHILNKRNLVSEGLTHQLAESFLVEYQGQD